MKRGLSQSGSSNFCPELRKNAQILVILPCIWLKSETVKKNLSGPAGIEPTAFVMSGRNYLAPSQF